MLWPPRGPRAKNSDRHRLPPQVVYRVRHQQGEVQLRLLEATMKIADIKGMNNAFWMTTDDNPATGDHFEIDVTEAQFPGYSHIGLQQYPAKGNKTLKHTGMAGAPTSLTTSPPASRLWRALDPKEMIFEVDGSRSPPLSPTALSIRPPTSPSRRL